MSQSPEILGALPTKAGPGWLRARARRYWLAVLVAVPGLFLALWVAVNRIEWLGPIVADSLRSVVGTDNVAKLEDTLYGLQDRFMLMWRKGEKPKAYWKVPPQSAPALANPAPVLPSEPGAPTGSGAVTSSPPPAPAFHPLAVGPVHKSWSAPGDGEWVPMPDVDHPTRPVTLYKTLLHPDKDRSWAELFVVAIDLTQTHIELVPGKQEPVATEEQAADMVRPGRIPPEYEADVIAAFNGGFKTEHGAYGMKVNGLLIVAPQPTVCTIARYKDDSMRVASWPLLKDGEADMVWWRQTPNCMYEHGKLNAFLKEGRVKKWGATLDGETVIRRSAIGISEDGHTLYVSISNNTTAPAIAWGMQHAGAVTVAQLDINYSFPKFVTFEASKESGKRIAIALADGFEFSENEFIRKSQPRDFFYILPRSLGQSASNQAPSTSTTPH